MKKRGTDKDQIASKSSSELGMIMLTNHRSHVPPCPDDRLRANFGRHIRVSIRTMCNYIVYYYHVA